MPMKPRKGESQSDFTSRCVPEMMGDGKREQEQAVAACLSIWREAKGEKPPPGKSVAQWNWEGIRDVIAKFPTIGKQVAPRGGESRDDFLERCVASHKKDGMDDAKANEACAAIWNDSNKSFGGA